MALEFEIGRGWGDANALGLVVLQADETIEQEFRHFIGTDQFAVYHTRVPSGTELTLDTLARMEAEIPAAVGLLPMTAVFDVIGYACTSGATIIGEARVAELIRSVYPGVAATNPLTAVKAALKVLNIRKLGFLTPYVADVSDAMQRALEDDGVEITAFASFEQSEEAKVARIAPHSILDAVVDLGSSPACEAVFISCTNLRTLDVLAAAEKRLGKPVISSNQVLAWHMVQLAGHSSRPEGLGALFDHDLAS